MSAQELKLIRPDPAVHTQPIADLTGKTFGNYWSWQESFKAYFGSPTYDWGASTIGLIGGQVVTHWGIWGFPMRIGRAVVRVAGVGAVATNGQMRGRGLMAATARAGVEAARQAGYDLNLLFGIHEFYHRFGFVRAYPITRFVVEARRLPEDATIKLRETTPEDEPHLVRLYNRYHAGLTGTAVRPTFSPARHRSGFIWCDSRGTPAGYAFMTASQDGADYLDSAGEARQVAGALRQIAERGHAREVRMYSLHERSDLARLLRRGTCRVERNYVESGGAMIRTLSLDSTLRKMCPELSARLKRSHLSDWRGELAVADPRERVVLKIAGGKVALGEAGRATRHVVRGREEIVHLLIGMDEPDEVAAAGRMRLSGDARPLASVLFPKEYPQLSQWDYF